MLIVPTALEILKEDSRTGNTSLAVVLHPGTRARTKAEVLWLYFDTMEGRTRCLCFQLCPCAPCSHQLFEALG